MTTVADRVLIDTNVLVYASLRQSAFHAQAAQAIHAQIQAGAELWVSRQILREYIAVLTRPGTTTLASPATTAASDVAAYQQIFHVADDTAAVTANLLALVQSVPMCVRASRSSPIPALVAPPMASPLAICSIRFFRCFAASVPSTRSVSLL